MREYNQMKYNRGSLGLRIQWLDICKGILIFNVILSHSYPPTLYRQFFTPFFLTMFFFASGYTFSAKSTFKEFIVNKIKRLLIPFFLLGLSRVLMSYVIERGSLMQRLKGFVLQISCRYDELWFVSCLFTSSLLFYLIITLCRRQKRFPEDRLVLIISSIISILGLADMCIWKIKFVWELETACMMLFYMALGYWYRRYETGNLHCLEKATWAIPLAILYVCIVLFFRNDVDIHKQTFEFPIPFVLLSLIVIPPIIYISKMLCHSCLQRTLAFLGTNTLFYYAYAGIIRVLFYSGCSYLGISNEWILPLLCALVSAILMAFPAWLVKKYLPWAVGSG